MDVKRWTAALGCASVLVLASPVQAEAAPARDSLMGWVSRTVAAALQAIAGSGSGTDLQPGGALALDRSLGTVVGGLRSVAPELQNLNVDVEVDRQFRPGFDLDLRAPFDLGRASRMTLSGTVGLGPGGNLYQSVELGLRRDQAPGVPLLLSGSAALRLGREDDPATARTTHRLAGHLGWAGLQLGGSLRDDRAHDPATTSDERPIDAAEVKLVANLPDLPWAEVETRHAWSPPVTSALLAWSASDYLMRLRPLGPLEVTAGHQRAVFKPDRWYTSVRLKMILGGPI